jgi:transposase InsO family protein
VAGDCAAALAFSRAGKPVYLVAYTNVVRHMDLLCAEAAALDASLIFKTRAIADLLNDRVIPFYDEHGVVLQRVLTDRGTEYCGTHDRHEYELYLAVENIDHSRTKTKSPQTNGIVERFHKTMLDEFYRIAFRKRIYATIDELQADLDAWLAEYNEVRTHQGRYCYGKTPMQTFLDAAPAAREKQIGEQALATTSA